MLIVPTEHMDLRSANWNVELKSVSLDFNNRNGYILQQSWNFCTHNRSIFLGGLQSAQIAGILSLIQGVAEPLSRLAAREGHAGHETGCLAMCASLLSFSAVSDWLFCVKSQERSKTMGVQWSTYKYWYYWYQHWYHWYHSNWDPATNIDEIAAADSPRSTGSTVIRFAWVRAWQVAMFAMCYVLAVQLDCIKTYQFIVLAADVFYYWLS